MRAPAEVDREMAIGASFPQFFQPTMRGIIATALTVIFVIGLAAQSTARGRNKTPQTSTPPSPFLEAEQLLRHGSIAEAKTKIQEQLQADPSSVEGYNLLGII